MEAAKGSTFVRLHGDSTNCSGTLAVQRLREPCGSHVGSQGFVSLCPHRLRPRQTAPGSRPNSRRQRPSRRQRQWPSAWRIWWNWVSARCQRQACVRPRSKRRARAGSRQLADRPQSALTEMIIRLFVQVNGYVTEEEAASQLSCRVH